MQDSLKWHGHFKIDKYEADGTYVESVELDNLVLNQGITEILNLLVANSTEWSQTNMRLVIGDSTTAAVATQTALLGSNQFTSSLSAAPSVSGQSLVFTASIGSGVGLINWNEIGLLNNSTSNLISRAVGAQGNKATYPTQTWSVTYTLTLS